MLKRVGRYTIVMEEENRPAILGYASIAGKKEQEGPLGAYFDKTHTDTTLGKDSWEQAESALQTQAVQTALQKANVQKEDVDYIFAGDLLNQSMSSTFGLRSLEIPFLGQFGACSTMAQTLGLSSLFVGAGLANRTVAVTSSHFCSAERQFRFPLEYGGQRTPTAQWTATAAGSVVVGKSGASPVEVASVTFGRIVDLGIKDANNMGAAMAPSAAQTLKDHLTDTNTTPEDYDLILTGDLAFVGSALMEELLQKEGIEIHDKHNDCGLMIYDREEQDTHAGASGCGCSAAVLCSIILQQLSAGELNRVLFMGTGALMSPTSSQQGETVPGVTHLVSLVHTGTKAAESN